MIRFLISLILIGVVIFGMYLRYEDFNDWKKFGKKFQYQGQYQMANFDSYYYLRTAKEIQNDEYDTLDEKRRFPNGVKRAFIPPLLSWIAAKISSIFNIPLDRVAIYTPVLSAPLLAIIIFFISQAFNFKYISSLSASFFSIISIGYITRTRIGVFDTDCLNVTFLLITCYMLLQFSQIKNCNRYYYLLGACINFLLHYIFWNTVAVIVLISFLFPLTIALVFYFKTKKDWLKYIILASIIVVGFCLNYNEFMTYFDLFINKKSVFPNNISISELDKISFKKYIEGTTRSKFILGLSILGLVVMAWKYRIKMLFFLIPLSLLVSPFFLGIRFLAFCAPMIAVGIGYIIELTFNFRKKNQPQLSYLIALAIAIIGISFTFKPITKGFEKPAAYNNIKLLTVIEDNIPRDATIWTSSDIGYQILYYLNNPTYADGEFTDKNLRNGELHFNLYFPFTAKNFALSANFIQFYSVRGLEGTRFLEKSFRSVETAYSFMRKVFSKTPGETRIFLEDLKKKSFLPNPDTLTTTKKWLEFLYPKPEKDNYLFLYHLMSQTGSWFKQGNSNLKTLKTKGLPLFLALPGLKNLNSKIQNTQIDISLQDGSSLYNHQKSYLHSITTYTNDKKEKINYPENIKKTTNKFIFQWNSDNNFGAILDKEMDNMTFIRLFLGNEESDYFIPVDLKTPDYQIWKIQGDTL